MWKRQVGAMTVGILLLISINSVLRAQSVLKDKAFRPSLKESRSPSRSLFWEHEGNHAVREGRWKLVSKFPDSWELYDMEADRTEMHDIADQNPERVRQMSADY